MAAADADEEIELEWEEWDGKSPFLHHCIAGSIAGVAEHTLLYPVDTVKTHIMSYCADCPVGAQIQAKAAAAASGEGAAIRTTFQAAARPPAGIGLPAAATTAAASLLPSPPPPPPASGPQHGMIATMRNLVSNGYQLQYPATGAGGSGRRAAASLASAVMEEATAASASAVVDPTRGANGAGVLRLWRGVQTMVVGCVPAHALYFSSYEAVKAAFLASEASSWPAAAHPGQPPSLSSSSSQNLGPVGSAVAGATAALFHDLVMTPLDTVKQRMQLGHYRSMGDAIRTIVANEGAVGLYRSFPITLLTNLPYGMVMVSTNEFLREVLKNGRTGALDDELAARKQQPLDIRTTMLAGCGAGTAAAAVTTPLDRIKTRLQTQRLGTALAIQNAASCDGPPLSGGCPKARAERALLSGELRPRYANPADAFRSIVREEGYAGLFRGAVPRLVTHAPAVAISWTSYEAAKGWLATNFA